VNLTVRDEVGVAAVLAGDHPCSPKLHPNTCSGFAGLRRSRRFPERQRLLWPARIHPHPHRWSRAGSLSRGFEGWWKWGTATLFGAEM